MDSDILAKLQRDLDATGLGGRVNARREVGHFAVAELVREEDDPDRSPAGMVGLAHRLPLLDASRSARHVRAAAQFLQELLVEWLHLQWPTCDHHRSRLVTPQADQEHGAVWICTVSSAATSVHVVAEIGGLTSGAASYRGRLPRRR